MFANQTSIIMQRLYPQLALSTAGVAAGTHLHKTSPCFILSLATSPDLECCIGVFTLQRRVTTLAVEVKKQGDGGTHLLSTPARLEK